MFKNFKFLSKTNIGAAIAAVGIFLRGTGNAETADVIDASAAQLQEAVPVAMQAVGGLLTLAGIGHKIDKSTASQ